MAVDGEFNNGKTLCAENEDIYFSCALNDVHKIVSICAAKNTSPDNGYVQYRFGRSEKYELLFPEEFAPPIDRFSISDFYGGSLNSVHLKFKLGNYTYVVYQSATSGVYVVKNGRVVRNLSCDSGQYRQISPKATRGIKTVAPDENDD
ncbi:hypothetical protein [Caballeronia sp. KNU42]